MLKKKTNSTNKGADSVTSSTIQQKTKEFLERGGQINIVDSGVSSIEFLKKSKNSTDTTR